MLGNVGGQRISHTHINLSKLNVNTLVRPTPSTSPLHYIIIMIESHRVQIECESASPPPYIIHFTPGSAFMAANTALS